MSEDLHIRISKDDLDVIRNMISRKEFATISEFVRYGIKQLLYSYRFASEEEEALGENTRAILQRTMQPTKNNVINNVMMIRERKVKHEETDRWIYFESIYPRKQLISRIDKLLEALGE